MEMEATCFSKTSVHFERTTRCYIQKDIILQEGKCCIVSYMSYLLNALITKAYVLRNQLPNTYPPLWEPRILKFLYLFQAALFYITVVTNTLQKWIIVCKAVSTFMIIRRCSWTRKIFGYVQFISERILVLSFEIKINEAEVMGKTQPSGYRFWGRN
jgi:hypothetical protein